MSGASGLPEKVSVLPVQSQVPALDDEEERRCRCRSLLLPAQSDSAGAATIGSRSGQPRREASVSDRPHESGHAVANRGVHKRPVSDPSREA